jgi:uncharacterized ferritin-like protein (DUF455 family)
MSTTDLFLEQLEQRVTVCLSELDQVSDTGLAFSCDNPMDEVVRRLKVALKNEIEASELAASWMASTPETDVKLGLARQAGDEAKHYRLIEEHLDALGVDISGFDPLGEGYSPMFQLLRRYKGTVERVAAAQYTRESLALTKNEQFIKFCAGVGAMATAEFYRNHIQPDEQWHVRLGIRTLKKYATSERLQAKALEASEAVLDLATRIHNTQVHEMGLGHSPGC